MMSLLSHCHGEKTKDVTEDTLETVVCQDIDISASLCAMIVSRLIYAAKLLISFQTCKKLALKMQNSTGTSPRKSEPMYLSVCHEAHIYI